MRPTFGREYIEEKFQRIADGLFDPLTVYLIGGGAMSLHDLKGATKDIDLTVADGDTYGPRTRGVQALGEPKTVDELAADLGPVVAESQNESRFSHF